MERKLSRYGIVGSELLPTPYHIKRKIWAVPAERQSATHNQLDRALRGEDTISGRRIA